MDQGTLSAGSITSKNFGQEWTLDQLGNWATFEESDSMSTTLDQDRAHNDVNETGRVALSKAVLCCVAMALPVIRVTMQRRRSHLNANKVVTSTVADGKTIAERLHLQSQCHTECQCHTADIGPGPSP